MFLKWYTQNFIQLQTQVTSRFPYKSLLFLEIQHRCMSTYIEDDDSHPNNRVTKVNK